MVGNSMVHLLAFTSLPAWSGTTRSEGNCLKSPDSNFLPLGMEGNSWDLLATFWPFCGLPKGMISVLIDSKLRQKWQHRRDPRLEAMKICGRHHARETCGGIADLQGPGGGRLWAPIRSRDETLSEIKTFKSSHLHGITGEKYTRGPGKRHAQKRAEKTLNHLIPHWCPEAMLKHLQML